MDLGKLESSVHEEEVGECELSGIPILREMDKTWKIIQLILT